MTRRWWFGILTWVLVVFSSTILTAQSDDVMTVVVVRHAEKAGPSGDVPLNDVGRARAELLAQMLAAEQVTGLLSTPFQRTQQTLAPLAAQTGLDIELTPIGADGVDAHVQDVAARAKNYGAGTVVVAGHSNTVPAIVEALGVGPVEPLTDEDYDDMFVVTLYADGTPSLFRLKYAP